MGLNGINLIVGIVTGIVLSSIVWGVVISLRLNKSKKNSERSNELIVSIADLLADIENMSRLHVSGKISKAEFVKSFESKYETVNRSVKSGMHMLDIYFVKYVELFLEQINKSISKQDDAQAVSKESSAAMSFVQPSISEVEEKAEIDDAFDEEVFSEVKSESAEEQFDKSEKYDTPETSVSIEEVEIEDVVVEEPPKAQNNDVVEDKSEPIVIEQESVEVVEQKSDDSELDIDSFEANIPEEFIEEKNQEQDNADFAEEAVLEHKNIFDTNQTFEAGQDNSFIDNGFDQNDQIVEDDSGSDFVVPSSGQSEILSEVSDFDQPASSDEEDFSMETIIDYDVNKIKDIAFGNNRENPPVAENSEESNCPDEEEILCNTIQIDRTNIRGEKDGFIDNDEATNPPKVSDLEKNTYEKKQSNYNETSEQGDVAITGDDVASKIDSFFGFDR